MATFEDIDRIQAVRIALSPTNMVSVRRWAMAVTWASVRDAAMLVTFVLVLATSGIPGSVLVAAATNAPVNGAFLAAAGVYALWFAIAGAGHIRAGRCESARDAAGTALSALLRALVFVPLGAAPSAAQGMAAALFQAMA